MIDRATVNKILDAVRIEEVIGDFVSLRKRGANYLGLCPFHDDKNPSLSVSTTKQIFKCFSCGKAGTAVSFLMEHEHISYPEALKYLAKKYRIEIVEKEETPEEIADRLKSESLLIVSEYAQKFYQDYMWDAEKSRLIGLGYFRERKFTDDTIRKFGLGFAPDGRDVFSKNALEKGYKKEFLVDSGLSVEKENGELADRFYNRVMFPIHSLSGRVIAFGGRILTSDKKIAKYINSPETEIYVKNRVLYGIYYAKAAIAKADKCYLVEGYTDVISMHQAGIENVVASSGTSLTVGQINLIKRFTENVTVLYDGDAAGIKASIRGVDMILSEGMKVKVVLLPPEDDPDSFAKAHSRDEIDDYMQKNEVDFITFKTNLLLDQTGNDPIKKASLINDIIETVSVIPDQIERNVYVDMVAERFKINSDSIFQKIAVLRKKRRELEMSRQAEYYYSREAEPNQIAGEVEVLSGSTGSSYQENPAGIYLSVTEKELIYYLLKYGEYPLHGEDGMYVGVPEGDKINVNVADYILSSLKCDELELQNPLYKRVMDLYFSSARRELDGSEKSVPGRVEYEVAQEKIIRYFANNEDPGMVEVMTNIICEKHPLTVKVYRDSLVPENNMLGKNVLKALLLYKVRVLDLCCKEMTKGIADAEKKGDSETQKELMRKLLLMSRGKIELTKELDNI